PSSHRFLSLLWMVPLLLLSSGCNHETPRSCDWIASIPESEMNRKVVVGCTPCHPIGLPIAFRLTAAAWNEKYVKMKEMDDELELKLIPFKSDMELPNWLGENSKLPSAGFPAKISPADYKEFPLGDGKGFYHDMALAGGRA